jgi:hypothetical protein
MSCKYQKQAGYQEGRIRYLERELKVAGEEINSFKAGNNCIKIKDQDISDDLCNWSQPKNSKSRSCRFSADYVLNVKLSNRFTVLHIVQPSKGFLKHVEHKVKPLAGKTKSEKENSLLGSSHVREI